MSYEMDYVLVNCPLENLINFTENISGSPLEIQLVKHPELCLTLLQAMDSVEFQPFYLGEVLTTVCEVLVNGQIGTGICLGEEPDRAYCMAIFDALFLSGHSICKILQAFLNQQALLIAEEEKIAFNQVLLTKVDFKLMDQT